MSYHPARWTQGLQLGLNAWEILMTYSTDYAMLIKVFAPEFKSCEMTSLDWHNLSGVCCCRLSSWESA